MKGFKKRSEKQPKRRRKKTARNMRMDPRRHGKEAGWAELSHQEAISYWTQSQGAR
ncbi:MAG: hypothetical protein JW811_01825 [Clostridiales bacterium]|nr:hypothetical protein [Clostridiales bacterium]